MILALDVHYRSDEAKAVGILFRSWTDEEVTDTISIFISDVEVYVPGEFYKRELPCLLAVINSIQEPIELIIVDGYVTLGEEQKPGLGKHLYDALEQKIPVIGVAKTSYAGINPDVHQVFRGQSRNPLFVTSIGIDVEYTASKIGSMAGEHRIPTLLGYLDRQTKKD